jgi:hypothetical protein
MIKKYFKKTKNGYRCEKCYKEYFDIDLLVDCWIWHERERCIALMDIAVKNKNNLRLKRM